MHTDKHRYEQACLAVDRSGGLTRGRHAFTLVEVLATMLIMAIVLPAAMAGVSVALSLSSNARHRAEAATLAQGELEDLVAAGSLETGQLTGDFGDDWPDYRWVATRQPWSVDSMFDQIDVAVFWTSRNQEYSVAVSTLAPSTMSSTSGGDF